jgi:capsid assembly protease
MNKPSVLARLFGRSKHPVVGSLATAALNRPLLVHPAMGESLIGAYLEGAVTSADTVLTTDVVPAEKIGVINISGGLVNRPMPGPSGGGPVSYAALRDAFDALVLDDEIGAIVLRFDSPGGMAAGCFDLVDHIYAARGKKPIHALVDDYAYSAAFAIASACDQIWVSRTGGVGSVGVVSFHYDWSSANTQMGVKVTPIYAGARKIDFNSNFALTDEAKEEATLVIEGLYSLFTETVARNLGVATEAVKATEARTFVGQAAVDAGFATQLGTWEDLVASLGLSTVAAPASPGETESDPDDELSVSEPEEPDAVEEPIETGANSPPSEIATAPVDFSAAVADSALPAALSLALIRRGALNQSPEQAVAYAQSVVDACAAAGLESVASDYVKTNTSIEIVRTQLLAAKAEDGPEVVTALPATGAAKQGVANSDPLNPQTIYKKRGN